MRKLFINLLWTLNLLAAFLLVGAYLSPFINPNRVSLFAFLGLSYPILLNLNLGFIILWIFVKRRLALLSLIIVLAGYPMLHRYFQLFPDKVTENQKGIKVMSYNVRNFQQLGRKNTNATMKAVKNLIKKQKPDIVCLQEFKVPKKAAKTFKLNMPVYGQGENLIFTKLKVVRQGIVINKEEKKFGVYVDLLFNTDTIRVYSIQLLSYSVSRELESYDKKERVNRKRFIFSIAAKLNSGFTRRVRETETLRKVIAKSPYPVVVCGDFNDPPASFTYQQIISNDLIDAFIESGSGFGNTYFWTFPKVRIDYILTSKKFDIYNYEVLKTNLSDHLPVTAVVVPL